MHGTRLASRQPIESELVNDACALILLKVDIHLCEGVEDNLNFLEVLGIVPNKLDCKLELPGLALCRIQGGHTFHMLVEPPSASLCS